MTPSLALREEYNDNVSAVTSGGRADFISTLSPKLSLSRGGERGNATLATGLDLLHYLRDSNDSAVGYFAQGGGNFAATPRLSLSTDLGYTRDSSASSIDPETALVTSSRAVHQSYRMAGRYQVSELLSSSLALSYARDDYDSPIYHDSRHYLASAGTDYDLGRRLPGAALAALLSLRSDRTDQSRVDNVGATLGLVKGVNELWRLSLNGGARYTRSEFPLPGASGDVSHDETAAVGSLALAYAGERSAGSLVLSHDLSTAAGRNAATQKTGASASLTGRLTRRLSGQLKGAWTRNRSGREQFSVQQIDERASNLGCSLKYTPSDPSQLALEASYNYNSTYYKLLGSRMEQNVVMLKLSWQNRFSR